MPTTNTTTNTNTTTLSAMTGEEVASIIVNLIRQNDGVLMQQKITDGINQSTKWADLTSADAKMTQVSAMLQQIINANIFTKNLNGYVMTDYTANSIMDIVTHASAIYSITDNETITLPSRSYPFKAAKIVRLNELVYSEGNQQFQGFQGNELHLPKMIQLSGYSEFNSSPYLKILDIHSLNHNGGSSNNFSGDTKLIDIIWGNALTQNSTLLQDWQPTEAMRNDTSSLVNAGETFANNREKLLSNIRLHIAANLEDRHVAVEGGATAYTITFNANLLALFDTATLNAFTSRGWAVA